MRFLFAAVLLLAGLVGLPACRTAQAPAAPSARFLPAPFRDLAFGMPLAAFQVRRPEAVREGPAGFRVVYAEENPAPGIVRVDYYFDNEGERPLYELIIEYADLAERARVSRALFGDSNVEDTVFEHAWRVASGEGYDVTAWTFERVLVVAAVLPGTEWAE